MDLFQLTRTLIDIESITPNEREMCHFLFEYLSDLAQRFNGEVERLPVEPDRDNVFARFGTPLVTLSTHMDTVPPFIPSRDDAAQIWGRGACDTKGIIAAMLTAAERLLSAGQRNFGLLFVVGEERNSAGALAAAKTPRGSKYIINGEPTENRLALGSKGALRFEIVASGRMAHSAYPELGESAIEKLLNALERLRKMPLPVDDTLGPSTLNIGIIRGGRAPNVIADEAAAEIFIRVVGDVTQSAPTNKSRCRARCRGQRGSLYPRRPSRLAARFQHHRCGLHLRHPSLWRYLGPAVSLRSRNHSRRSYQ